MDPQGASGLPLQATSSAPRRLTGVAGLLAALGSWGLLGRGGRFAARGLEHFAADDGQRVPVRVLGDGAPVVLVHGIGCSHRHWMPVARRLARHHRVFAWDARGHGCSVTHPQASPLTLARLAADLAQLLTHFALPRAALVGHSMGALIVLRYLADHGRDRVAAVALVDQSPRIVTDDDWRCGLFGGCSAELLLGLIDGARRDLAGTLAHEVDARHADWWERRLAADAWLGRWLRRWLGRVDTGRLLDLAESLARADFRSLLPTLDVPLQVVLGGRSAHYGEVPLAQYYRSAVPHAEVAVYARAGHSPHVAEAARFARELRRFIADHA
jgi:pimeloyl-ACP methyl ester carboxylesterase